MGHDTIDTCFNRRSLIFMCYSEYYKRHGMRDEFDLSSGAVGITGVGPKLLEEVGPVTVCRFLHALTCIYAHMVAVHGRQRHRSGD